MINPDIRAALARERQNTLLAGAEAARTARQARLRRVARGAGRRTSGTAAPVSETSMDAGVCSVVSWLSFGRIIDIPFETCVAALESWQRMEQGGELRIGQSVLRWPTEHDRDACRIEVGLARGPLRPRLRMRLDINRWSPPSSRTALELIPGRRVRPTAAYFRSGHHLLDSLSHSLLLWGPWLPPDRELGAQLAAGKVAGHGEGLAVRPA
jgi:hypothetical protein